MEPVNWECIHFRMLFDEKMMVEEKALNEACHSL